MATSLLSSTEAPSITRQVSETAASASATDSDIPSPEDIERKPWKFIGYRRYAEFIASDEDFHIFRRFDALNARILLYLQDDISALEEELAQVDQASDRRSAPDFNNGTFRNDPVDERTSLLEELCDKVYRYNEYMLQQSTLGKYPIAPKRDTRSIRNWHHNHQYCAIAKEEQKYLDAKDLICIFQKNKTPLRRAIDKSYTLRTMNIWSSSDNTLEGYDASDITYYSDKRIDRFASVIIIAIGMCLLIVPLWILQALESLRTKLAVITAFIFVFLLILSVAMVSNPFEALAATAAYAAILMVFMQID